MLVEAEDVGRRVQPAQFDELDDALLTQAFDVECTAGNEVPETLEPLRGADQPAGAAHVDLTSLRDGFGIAHRATVGEDVSRPLLVAGEILDHLRDDVAGALDADEVADAQAKPRD